MDLRDRYPEIERPLRGDGGPEAVSKCLEPIIKNLERINLVIMNICAFKELDLKDIFAFQSRVMGTCKPTSDIDIYIQLKGEPMEFLIESHGVKYTDTHTKVICGAWGERFFADLPPKLKQELADLHIDMFYGVESLPPAKPPYIGRNYYIALRLLRGR